MQEVGSIVSRQRIELNQPGKVVVKINVIINNEQRVCRASSQHVYFSDPDSYDPSAPSSDNFEYFCRNECVNDNACGSCSVRENFSPLAPFSSLSENESADSVHSGLRFPFSAQQDNPPGHNAIDGDNRPYSPIPDSSHPWDETQQRSSYDPIFVETTPEIQQQPYDSTLAKTRAGSQGGGSSRHRCNECNKSFADKNGLKRHVKTIHNPAQWVCTVAGCRKFGKAVSRKDDFRRHCKKRHPTVNLEQFGL
ncbi:uncharacterized protein PAC_02800 [Phialocephala subalpina]|uniref:C2H2-type domain-containing protein n=1 Tax=Phialocephala subalpina TaxID=576137 RepID=A0A1L7WJI2_9HELO|nr:uncharacterized protein PAC_02800 [Phialocephala subalpina]